MTLETNDLSSSLKEKKAIAKDEFEKAQRALNNLQSKKLDVLMKNIDKEQEK